MSILFASILHDHTYLFQGRTAVEVHRWRRWVLASSFLPVARRQEACQVGASGCRQRIHSLTQPTGLSPRLSTICARRPGGASCGGHQNRRWVQNNVGLTDSTGDDLGGNCHVPRRPPLVAPPPTIWTRVPPRHLFLKTEWVLACKSVANFNLSSARPLELASLSLTNNV